MILGYFPGEQTDPQVKCFVDDDETLYFHSFCFASPEAALLLAGCDGIAIVQEEDNCYFPIDWLIEQFGPLKEEDAEMLNKIKNNVLSAHRENLKLSSSPGA